MLGAQTGMIENSAWGSGSAVVVVQPGVVGDGLGSGCCSGPSETSSTGLEVCEGGVVQHRVVGSSDLFGYHMFITQWITHGRH